MSKVLVIDNGSYNIKIGYATEAAESPDGVVRQKPSLVPNCVTHGKNKRSYIGSQFSGCADFSGLTFQRPHEKGQLVDWRLEYAIWNYTFYGSDSSINADPSDTSLILTEAPMSLPAISSNTDQIIFEEYGFESYYRCTPGSLVPWNDFDKDFFSRPKSIPKSDIPGGQEIGSATPPVSDKQHPLAECALVVDLGFNSTTIMPTILGEVYWPAVQQISVGGRLLTNYLRETLSFRHYNMMEDTFLVNAIKESSCFVSTDFDRDLKVCEEYKKNRKSILKEMEDDEDNEDEDHDDSVKRRRRQYEDGQPFVLKYALPDNPSEIGHVIQDSGPKSSGTSLVTSEPAVPTSQPSQPFGITTVSASQTAQSSSFHPESVISERQILRLTTERFTIPEVLFNPHHVGLNQAGLVEAIITSVKKAPVELNTLLLSNIVLVGGSANLPGLKERLQQELESLVPSYSSLSLSDQSRQSVVNTYNPGSSTFSSKDVPLNYKGSGAVTGSRFASNIPLSSIGFNRGQSLLRVSCPTSSPETYAWQGGVRLGLQPEMLSKVHVSREEYLEYGERICAQKFNPKLDGSGGSVAEELERRNKSVEENDDDDNDDDDDDDL